MCNCVDDNNNAIVTLVDYRAENFLKKEKPFPSIKTDCNIIRCLLDDLSNPVVRNKIPKRSLVHSSSREMRAKVVRIL